MRTLLIAVGIVLITAPVACAPQKADPARQVGGDGDRQAHGDSDAATNGLESGGARAESDVPKLIAAVASPDAPDRWRAARALGDVGPGAAPAVPALMEALSDPEPRVRGHAARALGLIEDKSEGTIAGLIALVVDPEPQVRRAAITALGRLQPAATNTIPLMIKALEDADPSVVISALQTLAEDGADAVPALTEALRHKQGRYWACLVLAEMGPQAKAAVPQLTTLLKDDEPEVRMEAVIALGEIGPDAASAVPALTETLADASPAVRYASAFSLGKIGAVVALPALEKAEHEKDPFLSLVAAWAVAKLRPDDTKAVAKAVDLIVAALKQDDANVRRGAAKALWELNVAPQTVGPALLAALDDPDPVVQANVYAGLASLGQDAVPRLIERLDDPRTQGKVLRVLGLMGPEAKTAVPRLVEALAAADAEQRRELLFTLASIGADSAEATPAIVPLLGGCR